MSNAAPTLDDVWRLFQETDRLFKEQSRETDRRFQETDRLITRIDKQLGELGNRLGEFVEEMVRPAVVRLFQERGLEVHRVMRDIAATAKDGGEGLEIDLLVVNGDTMIGVECKSRLSQDDVDEHVRRLAKFKRLFPEYGDRRLLGAVAAMVLPDDLARYAYRQGLFVLAQSGDLVLVRNDAKFVPKEW